MNIQSNTFQRLLVSSFTFIAVLAGLSQPVQAADQQLGAYVDIQPRDIETAFVQWLNFGFVKVGSSGGTVTVSNDGSNTVTSTGDATYIGSGHEGILGIKGEKNFTVSVVVDPDVVLVSQNGLGADLNAALNPASDSLTLTASNGDFNLLEVGGTLTVPANQPRDTYLGYYSASVNYQ